MFFTNRNLKFRGCHRRSLPGVLPSSNPFATGVLLVLCLWLVPAVRLVAQVPIYTGTEITFVPTAINASGQIAGYGDAPGGTVHAVLYSGGNITDLGVLPGGDHSEATGINASGQVVGSSTTGNGLTHAFVYSGGVMTDLGTLPRGATSYATAINDAGQITGWSDTTAPNTNYPRPDHAFIYSGGVMTDLGNISSAPDSFGNFSVGNAINSSGQVVGWSINDNFDTHAFRYSGGHMSDLGTLGGSESRARGINDSGTVVGFSFTSGDAATHAFKFKNAGGMTDLGTLPGNNGSSAAAINNAGQIVGTSLFNGTPAFIYTDLTGIVKLDTHVSGAGWILGRASAINSAGQILASGSNATVFATEFLLSPPAIAPTVLGNISTRLRVLSGDNALIGGMIATGTAGKRVIIRAIGPSLTPFGVPGALANPTLELFQGSTLLFSNDDWNNSTQQAEIANSGLAPSNNAEAAIIWTLTPGQNYTAVVRGQNGTTGVGIVEAYDLDQAAASKLGNISTRGFVDVDDNVMIAGLIAGSGNGTSLKVLVRALGPTLSDFGVPGALANPTLDLVNSSGTVIRSNNNWKDDPQQRAAIEAAQLAPGHDEEAALVETVAPGAYTAVVRGNGRTTGVGLVEVYNIP